mgnify:CR=1 FL=1
MLEVALPPQILAEEKEAKGHLAGIANNWDDVVHNLPSNDGDVPNIFEEDT